MVAWLLSCLPSWITGRAGPKARREVAGWTKGNTTLRTLRYEGFRRLLLRGTDRPGRFAFVVALAALAIAYLSTAVSLRYIPRLPELTLDAKFDAAAFTGVPWSVQATLVALVYPIVLSFMALMLQRRVHSTVALRVYVLDSGVVPAGASSIALVLAMGLQYCATPYSTPEFLQTFMPALLVMNGSWLAFNLFLTAFFLARTLRFVQEDEQQYAFTRVAVDTALRSELTTAVKKSIVVGAPQQQWGLAEEAADDTARPKVRMFLIGRSEGSRRVLHRELKGSFVLHDVHLNVLGVVVRSWRKRALRHVPADKRREPVLSFPPMVGETVTGRVELCVVEDGPPLTLVERAIVRGSFWYRPSRRGTLSLSTRRMLDEIGGEVETASEQRRFSAADDALRSLIRLHKTLLLASAGTERGTAISAATMHTSPYAWGANSFGLEWLKPYREIARIATRLIDEDSRLFRRVSVVPASLALELPPRPEQLVIDAMLVGMNVAHQLAHWWTRKADAQVQQSGKGLSGTLPPAINKPYEQALIAFVGSWGELRIQQSEQTSGDATDVWAALTARAHVYAKHIENSAELFLKAVARGDDVAAGWFLDAFAKWWGTRKFELEHADPDEYRLRNVTLSLAERPWSEVRDLLWDGTAPVSIATAERALNLAIRRYWESLRLYLIVLLIQNAGPAPSAESRELRLAAALILGTPQHRGGSIVCWPLDSVDAVLSGLLRSGFGVESVERRIDAFAEKLRWEDESPEVSGWIYSWSGTPTSLDSMKLAQATLLVALVPSRIGRIPHRRRFSRHNTLVASSRELIERWWKDLDKLESVARYCAELEKRVLSQECSHASKAITVLQGRLENKVGIRRARVTVARALRSLKNVAVHERITTLRSRRVSERKVQKFAELAAQHAFGGASWPHRVGTRIEFAPSLAHKSQSLRLETDKKSYTEEDLSGSTGDVAERMGDHMRENAFAWCLGDLIARTGLTPANDPGIRHNYEATQAEAETFLTAVGARCASLRALGQQPVVLVGGTAPGAYLHAHRWGNHPWQYALPPGLVWRHGDPTKGEPDRDLLNDAPVYELGTPNGDCYVVPFSSVEVLQLGGPGLSSAVAIRWAQVSDERLELVLSWKAQFREPG